MSEQEAFEAHLRDVVPYANVDGPVFSELDMEDAFIAGVAHGREQALEEAAKVADGHGCIECDCCDHTANQIATEIRALQEKTP